MNNYAAADDDDDDGDDDNRFASGLVYYGLSLSTSTLAGDRYVNFFLSGVVEVPAYGLTIIVLKRYVMMMTLTTTTTTSMDTV